MVTAATACNAVAQKDASDSASGGGGKSPFDDSARAKEQPNTLLCHGC